MLPLLRPDLSPPSVLSATPSVTHSAKDLSWYINLPTFLFPFLNPLLLLCSFLIARRPNCSQHPRQDCSRAVHRTAISHHEGTRLISLSSQETCNFAHDTSESSELAQPKWHLSSWSCGSLTSIFLYLCALRAVGEHGSTRVLRNSCPKGRRKSCSHSPCCTTTDNEQEKSSTLTTRRHHDRLWLPWVVAGRQIEGED